MNIYRMELRRGMKQLIIWTGASCAVLILMILVYPMMLNSDFMELMQAKMEMLPKELIEMFRISGEDITQLPQFFAYMFQFALMAASIFGAMLGITALSREENEGTIEFLCAKPVRRSDILSAKLAGVITQYILYFLVLGAAGIIAGIIVRPPELSLSELTQAIRPTLFGGLVIGLTYLFAGFAVSVFLRKPRRAATIAVALFFLTYILGTIASLGVLKFLKWISPMTYFVPADVVMNGIDWANVLICVIIMGVFTAVSYAVYSKKDFPV